MNREFGEKMYLHSLINRLEKACTFGYCDNCSNKKTAINLNSGLDDYVKF